MSPSSPQTIKLWLVALLVLATTFWGGRYLSQKPPDAPLAPARTSGGHAPTLVSLSPGVTETIVALGAGEQLVGISDYCHLPGRGTESRVGTAITPHYEAIAQLAPALILTSDVRGEQLSPLSRLAPTHSLPWLTLEEWAQSVLDLGKLLDKKDAAQKLHDELLSTLAVVPREDAPRILLVLDYGDSGSNQIWFIRKNSIHGAALEAAGAKNAVADEVKGTPHLNPEQLLAVDPDGILLLRSTVDVQHDKDARSRFARFSPLRAVKEDRVGIVHMDGAMTVGPSVLKLVPLLRAKIDEITRSLR